MKKKYMLNSHTKTDCHLRPNLALYKSGRKHTTVFRDKVGVCFFQLFDPRHGFVSNFNLSTRDYFMHNFFKDLVPLKSKYLTKTYKTIPLLGFLTIWAFEIFLKSWFFWLKNSIVCRNAKHQRTWSLFNK